MRAIFLLCLSFCFHFLIAQSLVSSKYIGWSGSQIVLQTIRDKSGDLHASLLENPGNFNVILYDRGCKELHAYNLPRIKQEELVAGFIKDGLYYRIKEKKN